MTRTFWGVKQLVFVAYLCYCRSVIRSSVQTGPTLCHLRPTASYVL